MRPASAPSLKPNRHKNVVTIILKSLRKLIRSETKSKWYEGDEVISELVSRPWGEDDSETQCYQFTLRVLLDGAHGKKSLLSLVSKGKIPQISGNDIDGYVPYAVLMPSLTVETSYVR